MMMTEDSAALARLDDEMMAAHRHGGDLAALHQRAADLLTRDEAAVRFHLTHAFVYSLEAGDWEVVESLTSRLRSLRAL